MPFAVKIWNLNFILSGFRKEYLSVCLLVYVQWFGSNLLHLNVVQKIYTNIHSYGVIEQPNSVVQETNMVNRLSRSNNYIGIDTITSTLAEFYKFR